MFNFNDTKVAIITPLHWSLFTSPRFHTQLLPLLLESLDTEDTGLCLSTLEGLHSLVEATPTAVTDHVPTLVPRLLKLAKVPESMVTISTCMW